MLRNLIIFIVYFVFIELVYSQQVEINVNLCEKKVTQKKQIYFYSTGLTKVKIKKVRVFVYEYQVLIFNDDTVPYYLPVNRFSIINKNILSKTDTDDFIISNNDTLIVKEKDIVYNPVNKKGKKVLLYYFSSLPEEQLRYFFIFLKILPQSANKIFYYKAVYSPFVYCEQCFHRFQMRTKCELSKYRYSKKNLIVLRLYRKKFNKSNYDNLFTEFLFDENNNKEYSKEIKLHKQELINRDIYANDTIFRIIYKD